jgi:DNA-binding CsgD family transcriptional regulator
LLEGLSNKAIGLKMKISPRTVEFHRARLMHRFGAKSLVELIQKVVHDGELA